MVNVLFFVCCCASGVYRDSYLIQYIVPDVLSSEIKNVG